MQKFDFRLGHACCTIMADIRAAVRVLQLQAEQASEERELIRASLEQVLEASSSAYADHATEAVHWQKCRDSRL